MNRILLNIFLFFSLLSSSNSIKQKKTKFCINCKHFINDSMSGKSEFGKCTLFPTESGSFFVDGSNTNYYYYASTARGSERLCGEEGKHYQKKYKKRITKKEDELSSSSSFSMIQEISDDENNYYE